MNKSSPVTTPEGTRSDREDVDDDNDADDAAAEDEDAIAIVIPKLKMK